jgi:tRNA A-37 threonylcarbamoyl transferase component Bud32
MNNVYKLLYLQNLQKQKILQLFRNSDNQNKSVSPSISNPITSINTLNNQSTISKNNSQPPEFINPDLIRQKQFEMILKIMELKKNNINILEYLNQLKTIKTFNNIHEGSQKVELIEGYIVKKKCLQSSMGNFLFLNEVNTLKKLQGYPHFPHLIAFDSNKLIIYMTYCGETISNHNLPKDWNYQIDNISRILNVLNINSNDMSIRNTCCLGDELKIIDFGLNTQFKLPIQESIMNLSKQLNNLYGSSLSRNETNNYKSYKEYYPHWKTKLRNDENLIKAQITLKNEYLKKIKIRK